MNSNWSYSPETPNLGQIWRFFTSVTLTFDLGLWPFAWTSPLSLVITPENLMMIWWWEHSQKGVTDRQTNRQTEKSVLRAAWLQLKTSQFPNCDTWTLPALWQLLNLYNKTVRIIDAKDNKVWWNLFNIQFAKSLFVRPDHHLASASRMAFSM